MLSVITIDLDPVIHVATIPVHWYGVMYAIAFAVAYQFGVVPHLERRGVPRATMERGLLWTILVSLVGARLYYVVQQPDLGAFLRDPVRIIAVWEGGMAFFGAIIAGLATIGVFAWRNRLSMWLLWDAGAIFAVVGQPIGRIGNLINGDILGPPSHLPWATSYTNPHAILQACCKLGVAYQPAAAYEAVGTVIIGLLLLLLRRRGVRAGALVVAYIPLYALSQLILFQFRSSEPALGLGLRQAQWTAIAILVVVAPLVYWAWQRRLDTIPASPGGRAGGGRVAA